MIPLALVGVLVIGSPAQAYYRDAHRFRLRHVTVAGALRLLVTAHIIASSTPFRAVQQADPLAECSQGVPVKVQRRIGGKWTTLKKKKTNAKAKLRVKVADRKGRYRLLLPAYKTDGGFDCFKATSGVKRHVH